MISGLYAVTPDCADTEVLLVQARAALMGGARIFQYRSALTNAQLRFEQADALRTLCRTYDTLLIINNDLALAAKVDADGVHIGAHDASVEEARTVLGADKIVGVSCYDDIGRARAAAAQGADYVAFGSFFVSSTKPAAARPGLDLLRTARSQTALPIVAIGGVDLRNASALIAAGADAIAVISALFTATDIEATARQFCNLFDSENYDFA